MRWGPYDLVHIKPVAPGQLTHELPLSTAIPFTKGMQILRSVSSRPAHSAILSASRIGTRAHVTNWPNIGRASLSKKASRQNRVGSLAATAGSKTPLASGKWSHGFQIMFTRMDPHKLMTGLDSLPNSIWNKMPEKAARISRVAFCTSRSSPMPDDIKTLDLNARPAAERLRHLRLIQCLPPPP